MVRLLCRSRSQWCLAYPTCLQPSAYYLSTVDLIFLTKIGMADAGGRINTFEVRCPCGKSFENAETYLRHKSSCDTHQREENVTTSSSRRFATTSARVSPKPIACWCGRTFKNHYALQQHTSYCVAHKQQTNVRSDSLDPAQVSKLNSDMSSVSAVGKLSNPPAESAANKIQCPCGQRFANEKALNKHLRYSKTHQAGKPGSASTLKAQPLGKAPIAAPPSRLSFTRPVSNPVPGTIPSSTLSQVSLIYCTCGRAFETQRVLDQHKRDSLIHKRQADESATRRQRVDSLVSSFASLNLQSASIWATPSEAGFACECGRDFTSRKALEQHKRDARRHAWSGKGEMREKPFKTPRPQYQADEDLRDRAAVFVRQYGRVGDNGSRSDTGL